MADKVKENNDLKSRLAVFEALAGAKEAKSKIEPVQRNIEINKKQPEPKLKIYPVQPHVETKIEKNKKQPESKLKIEPVQKYVEAKIEFNKNNNVETKIKVNKNNNFSLA